MKLFIVLITFIFFLATNAQAQNKAAIEKEYKRWLIQHIWPQAQSKGISRDTFDTAFLGVTLNWELPNLAPSGTKKLVPKDHKQAEFSGPKKYFRHNSVNNATSVGRQIAKKYAKTLNAVEIKTGVPKRIILAIWGRESAYGRANISYDAFEVLGTKAFMSTRKNYFEGELIAALQIAQAKLAPNGQLKSSWAGALGQPQFMPTNFFKYGTDGNSDGQVDIWTSEADTIASIGTYLQQHGWIIGRDWGFEVTVPPSVSCTLEGPDQGRQISKWQGMGIRRVSGRPFPDHELNGEGFLMMPAGRHGPSFIVTPNFYVLKKYNKSDLYALFVGHIGDRIQYGVSDFTVHWDTSTTLHRSNIAEMQYSLESLGHDVGGVDGLIGFKTRRSIGRWQEATEQKSTCFPTPNIKIK